MAKNQLLTKLKRQKFRKRRGAYPSGSDASTLDPGYNNPALQQFWAERVATRPKGGGQSGVDRSQIPENVRGFVDYRGHAKLRPDHKENDVRYGNPKHAFFLAAIFPGVKFVSKEREDALKRMRDVIVHDTLPEYNFTLFKTTATFRRLYFTVDKSMWWFVERDFFKLRTSYLYTNKASAMSAHAKNDIPWSIEQTFVPSPDSS